MLPPLINKRESKAKTATRSEAKAQCKTKPRSKSESKISPEVKAKSAAKADAGATGKPEHRETAKPQATCARDRMNNHAARGRKRGARLLARRQRNFKKRKAFISKHFRSRKKEQKKRQEAENAENPTLYDKLVRVVINVLRGKRLYTPGLLGAIAKIGSCPSAGGSRAAIASIISHMGREYCAQETSWPLAQVGIRLGKSLVIHFNLLMMLQL